MKSFASICLTVVLSAGVFSPAQADYSSLVLENTPIAYWRFNESNGEKISSAGKLANTLEAGTVGKILFNQAGPRPPEFPNFETNNPALAVGGKNSFIRIKSAEENPLAFRSGETITIEAWVNLAQIDNGQDAYIIGKGRTGNAGFAADNQNWALRLRGLKGQAHLSFLFRDARNMPNDRNCWHRWVSTAAIRPGDGWHRVAVTYTFGHGDSARGWIDDQETRGAWDYGGKTDLAPVVDLDEVWIGSSQGGNAGSSFRGSLDEIAIYRGAFSPDKLAQRFSHVPQARTKIADIAEQIIVITNAPTDHVRVQILESGNTSDDAPALASVGADSADDFAPPVFSGDVSWNNLPKQIVDEFSESAFGFAALPTKYSSKGIKLDRPAPFLVRASSELNLPAGEYRVLLRSHNAARLSVDGKIISTSPFTNNKNADSEDVPDQAEKSIEGIRVLPPGHTDQLVSFVSDGRAHTFVLEAFVGGKRLRPEIGELCVALATTNGEFYLLSPKTKIALLDEDWEPYTVAQKHELAERDVKQRRVVSSVEDRYWEERHEHARKVLAGKPEIAVPGPIATEASQPIKFSANNAIDQFINQKLVAAKIQPAPLISDDVFLRRVTLDTTGLIPSPEQIAEFAKDKSPDRRAKAIDRLLANPSWADHWVSYWQDVLAENPGMLKPTLNNTGPFRWFLYDSFRDNKPMDRFVTELVQMDGSLYYGGPAGFAMASENDVPMAAKAQIVSTAFLGMELHCARCHDAPYQPFKQEQLFSLAAMLKRAPQKVPLTSSIPTNSTIKIGRLVEVTLAPGSTVQPKWPFANVVEHGDLGEAIRHRGDTREELAALITDPGNERFPRVIVNRIWKRYLGLGLVDPIDDWPTKPEISHPELLNWLAREFVMSGYDVKHVARLILNSQTYQRAAQISSMDIPKPEARLFAAPARRRLSAEQLVDSLFAAVGEKMDSEELNQDVDGRRPAQDFNNLGAPQRAWEFCSLANERDRPALALPRAQAIVDTLMLFGWRESRPNPQSVRDDSPNVLQPANLANSTLAVSIVRLSDENAITQLALKNEPLPAMIDAVVERVLSRPATSAEEKFFSEYLEPGFTDRRVPGAKLTHRKNSTQAVSWSNHLNAEATKIKLDLERKTRAGAPPTNALKPEWRERMEDVLWAMVNSPEFIYVP